MNDEEKRLIIVEKYYYENIDVIKGAATKKNRSLIHNAERSCQIKKEQIVPNV